MDLAAKHVGFVLASYGVAALLIGGLILAILIRARGVRRRLAELEAAGAKRRAGPARVQADTAEPSLNEQEA